MSDVADSDDAENWFKKGKEYNWLGDAPLSREAFNQAAKQGNTEGMRALAGMMFAGSGGPKKEEEALRLMWYAFRHDDDYALEELAELLGSYADTSDDPLIRSGAENAARKAEEAIKNLRDVEGFIRDQYVRKKRMEKSK